MYQARTISFFWEDASIDFTDLVFALLRRHLLLRHSGPDIDNQFRSRSNSCSIRYTDWASLPRLPVTSNSSAHSTYCQYFDNENDLAAAVAAHLGADHDVFDVLDFRYVSKLFVARPIAELGWFSVRFLFQRCCRRYVRVIESFSLTSGEFPSSHNFSTPTSDPEGACVSFCYDLWGGVVFRKFLAMRTMPHAIKRPRVMLIDGSANYIAREAFSRIGRAELQCEYAQKICAKVGACTST